MCRTHFERKGPIFRSFCYQGGSLPDEQRDRVGQYAKLRSVNLMEGRAAS
jgi:hypothetical protein